MTGNDLTASDIGQIALLFIGAPLMAFLGACFGLLGRVRRGGLLAATIVGLAGSAAASGTYYLGLWTLMLEPGMDPRGFLPIYESGYQKWMTALSVAAPGAVAFLFAIYWRLRFKPREPKRFAFSLSVALLVQVLSLLCVGSWCGLRLLVLQSADPNLVAKRLWESRGWRFEQHDMLALGGAGMQLSEQRAAFSAENLGDLVNYPYVKELFLADCDLTDVDLTPLKSARQLSKITFSRVKPDLLIRRQLPQLDQLASVSVDQVATSMPTLSSLAKLPKLTTFFAIDAELEREDLRLFLANSKLQAIILRDVDVFRKGGVIDRWPASLKMVEVSGSNLKWEDFQGIAKLTSLTHLHLENTAIDDDLLEQFSGLNKLQSFSFTNRKVTERGFEIITHQMRPVRLALYEGKLPGQAATWLGEQANLESLNLFGVMLEEEQIAALSKSGSLHDLSITSPGLTGGALLKLAKIPALRILVYPQASINKRNVDAFAAQISAERIRLGLKPMQVIPGPVIDEATAATYLGGPSAAPLIRSNDAP